MNDVPPHEVVCCHFLYTFPLSSMVSSSGKMISFRCCHFSYTFSFSNEASYGILSFFVYIFMSSTVLAVSGAALLALEEMK